MSTRVIGAGRRARIWAALVALALTVAVLVVAIQASSIWSAKTGSQVRPVPARIAASVNPDLRTIRHIGCWRPKWGCADRPRTSSHSSIGCWRPKWGCRQNGSAIAERP
jgi:hypothetical protein